MEKHEKNSVDIDSVSKKIDNYIKNNMSKETISEQEIRSALLEKYLMLSIANNEYIARDYVISIEESFSIYNRNEETKKLSSLKNKINKNIKKFIDNIRSSKKISKNVIDVKDLELYISNNKHNVYDMEISGTRVYVYIDNKNNQYEIVSLNNDKYTFESKNSLLDYINNNNNNNNNNNKSDESIKITAIAYKNKDFIKLTKKIEVWSINENTLINEVYENIKLKKTVKVNDDFSIKLVEQYDYKTIFIVKDNGNNNEHIVNIYSDDIKEAISIIIDSYSKINNNPESMIYEKNNKWYVKKKTTSGIAFAQGKDLITPVANILERINMVAGDYVNKLSDDLFGGFCYGLSLKYLMEVRNNGYENAENYLKWLKDTVILYKNKNKYSSDKVGGFKEKIQRAILEYELMELTNEVKNIIIAHNYQQERIKGLKYTYNTSDNTVPFSDILKKSGLVGIGNEQTLLNEKMFFEKIDELLTGSDNRYIFVGYKQHQTAITYKKYSDGKYKVTFFEPRFGIFEYDNIEDLKKIIKEKQKIYGLNKHGNELKYGYDEFLEVESQNYKSLFSNKIEKKDSRVFRNKNLADNLKSIDFSLEFSKEVTGRIMHYDEDGILIVQIKHNDRLIELRVIEKVVEDGLFLIKDNIDEIIKSQDVSKIILKKKNNSVEVIPIEFNTVIAEKKTVGYILFDKNEYIFIKNEPYHGLTDENKKTFDKVKLLINDLDSNIYFEKIKSSIEIIGAISKIIKSNKQVPIIEKLKNIKIALEKKLFHGELKNEKDKIITLSEKNIDIATKLYQVMINEINTGSIKESQFIYDNIIQNKLLNSKVTIPVGIKGYDYTITIETNSNLKDIIDKIDINQLKNMIYYDGKDKLHLRVTYDEIMIFQRNDNIKKLLNILDGKIKEYKTTDTKSNNEIFIENFANHDYVNRVLQLEFNELSNLSYTERSHYNNDNEVMVDYYTDLSKKYDNPSHFIKKVLSENKGKKGVSYILFNSNIENLNFINANHSILINNTITKIVTDLIPKIYQYDLNNYLKEIKHNGIITNLLKENEVLKKLVDMCTKSKISIIAAGESDLKGIHNKYISKNIANDNLYNSITDNTLIGENILIIADKDKIYNYRNENIHIEGLADRLNIPIFNVIEDSIKVLPNKIISDGSLPLNPYTEIGNNTIIRGEVEAETEYTRVINIKNKKISKEFYNNIVYSNKIYKKISKLYPLFRNDERFLLGYKNNIESVIPNYSKDMKNKEILDYIELNKYNISKEQLGAIIREIDNRIYQPEFKSKYSDKFTKLFNKISNNNGTDKAASLVLFPQQQLLLNLKNGAERRCESLTMLMLVAKYLEHGGDFGRGKALINNLLSVQLVINRDTYIDPDIKRSSEKLISSINELSKNYNEISSTINIKDNNKRSLDYVINKLTNRKVNDGNCYLQLYTSDHVITAWSKLEHKGSNFGLYDPNFGVVEFSSKNKFISYLKDFFSSNGMNAGKLYRLEKNIKNDFLFENVLNINVKSLAKTKLRNNTIDNIVRSDIINYNGINIDNQNIDKPNNIDIANNIKYRKNIINVQKKLDYLLDINTPNVKGYYSYCNDKVSITRKVVLLLSNESNLDNHYINFSQEYHKAGYDLFIFDSSMDAKAGSKAFEYLIKNYNVDTDSILLHGHSRSGGKVIELYESLNNKGYFPEGIVLSSSNNDLISVLNKENKLQHKTKIYISCDSKTTDENNKLIIKTLKAYGHDVKEFSFSHRNEYNSFRHVKDNQQDPIRKFSIYKSRDLELTPIGNILVPIVGMPSGDQKTLAKIANSENLIIGIRAIDNKSTALIASKEYSSKNLFIKGKSSDWGPMSGFIPVDQSLAKSSARNDVAKYNSAIQESINQGYAISVPLILSLERVNELKHNNILKFPGMLTDIIRVSSKIDNREYDFFLSKSNDNEYTVNYYDNSKLVPISVLSDPISKKPIIADYDLFTVMYSYNDLGEKTVIKKIMPWEEWKNSVDYEKLSPTFQEYYNDKALYERYEGEALGLISSKVKDVKDKINIALLREPGKEMVHHGADDANPYSVINDNFPATFFVPDEILNKNLNNEKNTLKDYFIVNENNTIIIRNTKEFSDFQQLMINHGFIAPLNERWNDGTEIDYFTKKRKTSHSYLKNRNILESKNHPNRYKSSLEEINNKYFDSTIKIIKSNNLDNIITTNIYKANEEIALLSSPYDHKKAIDIYLDNNDLYKKLPLSLKKDINKYRYDLDWFCEGGNKLFDYLMSSPENYLNRNDSKKLNNVFNIILELPEIKGSIYKSINVENLNAYFENIEQGTIFANDSILIANRNSQKIKNKTNNVFISIQGEHNAKTMTGISDRLTDQVILSPGKHFRVIKKEKIKGNLYMVLEATDILITKEPIFDLYNGKLKGFAIDAHRSTINEYLEEKILDNNLLDKIRKINNEFIDTTIKGNIIDSIIMRKLTPEYVTYRYATELSSLLGNDKDHITMINQIIHDPLQNKKYNQYINDKISRDEWLNSFDNKFYENISLKEKINNVKILSDAINDNPNCINMLADSSKLILSEFFSSDFDLLKGKLLRIVSSQESYKKFLSQIEKMNFYIANEKNYQGKAIKDIIYQINKVETNKKNYKNLMMEIKKKLLNLSDNKYSTSILHLPYIYNNEFSEKLTLLYSGLNENITYKELMECIELSEVLYQKSTSVELNKNELDYLSVFNSLLSDISMGKCFDNNITHLSKGNLQEIIIKLNEGNYILDVSSKRINLNISILNDNNYKFDVFISDIGNISIIGNNKKQVASDLFYFLHNINNLKNDNLLFDYDKNGVIGSIYSVDSKDIIPRDLFDKWRFLKNDIIIDINKSNIINIANVNIDKYLLSTLGCKIEGKSIKNINFDNIPNWKDKLLFDPEKLNNFFLFASGSEEDIKIISLFKNILENKTKHIKKILSVDASRIDYIVAQENLTKIIELNKSKLNSNYWENFRKTSLKIPRYMKIISKIGYANIGFGLWQSTNSTLQMIQSLLNEDLTLAQRKEIKTNLALMWSEMAYNGVSEFIEISIAKGMLRHKANPLDYAGKLSTRVGIALNILSVGFDIYNAYDNFSRIPEESNEKHRIDYIVNGSMAIVSGLITLGISIAMLAGSAIAGPIGIVAGVVIALATSIYNAARLIEDAKIKVHFTPWEELSNGFHVAFAGDFIPDKKNEIVLLETEKQLEELIDKNASNYFDEIKNINNFSYYFYSNEKQIYQEYYYYKVVPNLLGKTLDPIIDPVGNFITQRISTNMLQEEAGNIAASSYHLRAEKTGYKYFHPKEAIATNEILIFDIDFYVNELKRYTIDIIPEKDFPIFHQEIDKDFLKGVKSTKANVLDILDTQDVLENGLVKASEYKKYYNRQWSGNEALHFSTYNGDDIIAAPCETYNTFDIYNGTKRLSGGNKEDMFNLFTSESPRYASRFYGRGGNDTLRVINTTNNHMGYEIDLSKNYVKFRNSPTQTNSQNFHSTLFLYKDNDQLYSTKITDSMPNVELQDNMVIAYLDSFENIIGSSDGCDLLVGNDSDNYIDGVSGNDSIYGLKGNDVIRLSQGEAFGGEGKDIYIIARIMESVINKEKIDITINEINTSTASSYAIERSLIKLEHNFINIKSIHRNGTDIILILDNGFIENKNKNINEEKLLLPSTSLCLKNVFVNSTSYDLVNKYDVITNDGFILNLNEQISDSADPLYYFSYMEDYSNLDDKVNTISLNEEQREFNIRTANSVVKHTILPALKYTGLSEGASLKLSIDGNDKDNAYLSIGDGSLISLTNGADLYHLKTFMAKNKESYIDVKITNNGLNNNTNNISSFVLPDVNGYDLKFDNGVIIHRYNPDEYMKLNIKIKDQQLNSNIKIKIIDKYGKMFSLPERNSNNNLLIPNVKERLDITSHDDSFTIPEEMTLNKKTMDMLNIPLSLLDSQSALFKILNSKVKLNIDLLPIIDLLQGNDILINKNKGCSILAGGEGDDTLIVEDGHHLLFANEGNDKLYGGHGNDVLVSEHGNDYLEGGEGDDIYLITKHRGEVIVNDTQGDNTLFILGLNGGEVMSRSRDGDDEILRSQEEDADFTVRIKDKYSANENNVSYQIELRDERLTSEAYASIIDAMAKFNETQLSSMKGTDLPAAPDWSLLPVITGYLG